MLFSRFLPPLSKTKSIAAESRTSWSPFRNLPLQGVPQCNTSHAADRAWSYTPGLPIPRTPYNY